MQAETRGRAISVAGLVLTASLAAVTAAQGGRIDAGEQLLITEVRTVSVLGEIRIQGHGFCAEPVVTLAGERLGAASQGDVIVADLPQSAADGDYLLTVECGDGIRQFDAWALTIGAVGPRGPRGARGPRGPRGLRGQRGREGPPGLFRFGFYRRAASFECIGGGAPCDLTEADRPIAFCDEGDPATGGTAFRDPENAQLPLQDRASLPYPLDGDDAPVGWTTVLQLVPDGEVVTVVAICVNTTP